MNKWSDYKKEAQSFIEQLNMLQERMLSGDMQNLQEQFDLLYSGFASFVNHQSESVKSTDRRSREFLFKKQGNLILRNLDDFSEQNKKLNYFNQNDLLKLFEKQYKLKQILRKQIREMADNLF